MGQVMVSSGAMQAMVQCMREYRDDGVVQAKACGAMWNTANTCFSACDIIIRAGGARDVAVAMEHHGADEQVFLNAQGLHQQLLMC